MSYENDAAVNDTRSALSAAQDEQDEAAKEFVRVYAKLQEEDAAAEKANLAGQEYYKALSDYWGALKRLAIAHRKWDSLQCKWREATMPWQEAFLAAEQQFGAAIRAYLEGLARITGHPELESNPNHALMLVARVVLQQVLDQDFNPSAPCSDLTADVDRSGPGYLNRISASIGGASAGVKLPSGRAAA
jgi:hypothetical protein